MSKLDKSWPGWILTSTNEGSHSSGSLHYADRAIDIRKYRVEHMGVTALVHSIPLEELRRFAGREFDVVEEATHYHIEWEGPR